MKDAFSHCMSCDAMMGMFYERFEALTLQR